MQSLQQQSKPDSPARHQLFIADFSFQLNDDSFEALLSEWIEATPGHYQPYLARANYYYKRAWQARGNEWASETKEEQMEKFQSLLLLSLADINSAIEIDDKPLGIYSIYISIAHVLGQKTAATNALAEALKVDPADYEIRKVHLSFLRPRWGGSIEEMGAFVEESLIYLPENPRLNWLAGLVYDEIARISEDREAQSEAEKYYSEALKFGENYIVYQHRGANRYRMDKNTEALEDLSKAISLYPESSQNFYWRSSVYSELGEFEKAAIDLIRAYQLDPYDATVTKERDWLTEKLIYEGYEYNKEQKYAEALKLLNYAAQLSPENDEVYYWRARILSNINQIHLATNDLKKSISIDPTNYASYALLDWVLARVGNYDEIVLYWNKYIEIRPNHSSAYVERGGAYFQMGKYNEAARNAKIAADMGDPLGTEAYEKFKHLATDL